MLVTIFPSKRSSKISFQTSPEVRHQFRRKLRQLHSGNRRCLRRFWGRKITQNYSENKSQGITFRNDFVSEGTRSHFSADNLVEANYQSKGGRQHGDAQRKSRHLPTDVTATKSGETQYLPSKTRRKFKGQHDRGNRTESLWEGICLWEGLWEALWEGGVSEIFQRFLEVLRGFKRFWEVFRGFKRF